MPHSPHPPERALLDAARAYATATAGRPVIRVTLVLDDRCRRTIQVPQSPPPAMGPPAALLSPDALALMAVIADRGPVAPKTVVSLSGVERSRCYVLLTDLKDRGLIADRGGGYELADAELWRQLRGATGE